MCWWQAGGGRRLGGVLSRRADGRTGGRAAGAAGSLPAARRPGSAAGSAFGGGSGGRMCSRRALGDGCRRVDGRCLAGGGRSARLGGDDLTDGSAVIRRAVGWWRAVGCLEAGAFRCGWAVGDGGWAVGCGGQLGVVGERSAGGVGGWWSPALAPLARSGRSTDGMWKWAICRDRRRGGRHGGVGLGEWPPNNHPKVLLNTSCFPHKLSWSSCSLSRVCVRCE